MTKEPDAQKPPMTPEQIQEWIMLKGQGEKRFFKIEILDPDMAQEPNMILLMDTLSDFIYDGMKTAGLAESMGGHTPPHLKPVA